MGGYPYDRRLLIFRCEDWRIGEPGEICAFVLFDDTGEILAHHGDSSVYAFAYLADSKLSERLVARRCSHDHLDPSAVVSRVLGGEDKIKEGLAADQRAWKKYDRELDREAMAQEIQRTVKSCPRPSPHAIGDARRARKRQGD